MIRSLGHSCTVRAAVGHCGVGIGSRKCDEDVSRGIPAQSAHTSHAKAARFARRFSWWGRSGGVGRDDDDDGTAFGPCPRG
jgi:hypothetical protein